jgi:flagellar motility protein MotE (MotC chaperone)
VKPATDTAASAPARQSVPANPDSASSLWKELQNTRQELLQLTAQLEAERRQSDSLRTIRTAAAKLINAMNAEDAARVLGNVTDAEARDILLMISTRHAGKILSALDPGRAATILR